MATFNKFNAFVEHLAEGVHNLGADTITVALTATGNAPVATNSVLGDLTTVSTANIDDVTPTISSSSQTSGTYRLVLTDLTMTSTGGNTAAFRYVVLYNDSATAQTDALIGWYDYGSAISLSTGESLTLDFSATGGVISIT